MFACVYVACVVCFSVCDIMLLLFVLHIFGRIWLRLCVFGICV